MMIGTSLSARRILQTSRPETVGISRSRMTTAYSPRARFLERGFAVTDALHFEPLAPERVGNGLDDVRLVVGEENPAVHAASLRALARITRATRASPGLGLDLDNPAESSDGFADDGETKAEAFAPLAVAAVEAIEDAVALLPPDASSGVGHLDRDRVVGCGASREPDLAALGVFRRVRGQIRDHLRCKVSLRKHREVGWAVDLDA